MQTKETSFIHKLISSIKDFEEYPNMATKPFKEVLKYLIQLMFIFSFIVALVSVFNIAKDIQNGLNYFETQIPDLSFADNQLELVSEDIIRIETNNMINLIIIDTRDISDDDLNSYIEDIEKNDTGVIFLKDKIIINNGAEREQYSYEKIADMYNIGNMTKQDILSYFSTTNLVMIYVSIFIMYFIWLFISYLVSILIDAFIFGTIGYMTALLLKMRIRFIAMIKIAIHALTLPIILNLCYILMQELCGFEIIYFDVMYIGVTYIYIITAILMIKSDLIKRGQELTKIIEEEKKVKEQLEKEENQEEKNNKEEKKENKSDEDGVKEEPQGENA